MHHASHNCGAYVYNAWVWSWKIYQDHGALIIFPPHETCAEVVWERCWVVIERFLVTNFAHTFKGQVENAAMETHTKWFSWPFFKRKIACLCFWLYVGVHGELGVIIMLSPENRTAIACHIAQHRRDMYQLIWNLASFTLGASMVHVSIRFGSLELNIFPLDPWNFLF